MSTELTKKNPEQSIEVVELDDTMLDNVVGGQEMMAEAIDVNAYCPNKGCNLVAGCGG
jgi:hypothetical protein